MMYYLIFYLYVDVNYLKGGCLFVYLFNFYFFEVNKIYIVVILVVFLLFFKMYILFLSKMFFKYI